MTRITNEQQRYVEMNSVYLLKLILSVIHLSDSRPFPRKISLLLYWQTNVKVTKQIDIHANRIFTNKIHGIWIYKLKQIKPSVFQTDDTILFRSRFTKEKFYQLVSTKYITN